MNGAMREADCGFDIRAPYHFEKPWRFTRPGTMGRSAGLSTAALPYKERFSPSRIRGSDPRMIEIDPCRTALYMRT